jgi:hypothetical protein
MEGGDSEGDPRARSEPRAEGTGLNRGGGGTATRRRGLGPLSYLAAVPYLNER